MTLAVPRTAFTRRDYAQLPEGFPAQLIAGHLVKEPSPRYGHQVWASRFHRALQPFVVPDLLLACPVDVVIDDHNVYWPDVVVLPRPGDLEQSVVPTPLLVVEVLSPGRARRDRHVKTPGYLRAGVREVWLVDPQARTVERHTREGVRVAAGAQALASDAVAGFAVTPDVLFAPPASPTADR
jgi:Uma2 family endonuclease